MASRVKSAAGCRGPGRPLRALPQGFAALGLLLLAALTATVAQADRPRRIQQPLLLGGSVEVHQPQVLLDPLLPRGSLRTPISRPVLAATRCSLHLPVCAHASVAAEAQDALQVLEQAFELLSVGLGFPSPWGLSPGPHALHWSLTVDALRVQVETAPSRGFDRGRAFCVGGPASPGAALRCVAEAIVASALPATAPWLREGWGHSVLATLAPTAQAPSWRAAQRRPEDGVLTAAEDGRSALFFDFLQQFGSAEQPLSALLSALFVSATRTPPGDARYDAEPDLLDVLRSNLGGDRERLARLMDDFAAYRWRRGGEEAAARTDPSLFPELAWEIERKTLPRTLVLPEPLAPGGSAYLRVQLEAGRSGELALRTFCEEPVSYVWSLHLLDRNERLVRHVKVPFREQSTREQARIGQLEGASAVLAVGTNLGGVDLAHPFDPDHGPHERHACRVTFNWLEPDAGAPNGPAP